MLSIKVVDVVALKNQELLVFFEDGKIKKFDVKTIMNDYPEYKLLAKDEHLFKSVKVEPGGYGISWNEDLDCSEGELYQNGIDIPLSIEAFRLFAEHNLISTKDAASILNCSKQNIEDLVKRDKLHPVRYNQRYNLFFKSEVEQRTW